MRIKMKIEIIYYHLVLSEILIGLPFSQTFSPFKEQNLRTFIKVANENIDERGVLYFTDTCYKYSHEVYLNFLYCHQKDRAISISTCVCR